MPQLWPTLPNNVVKSISIGLFAACVVLELLDYFALRDVYGSACIEGHEVTSEVGHHLTLLWSILVPDIVYLFLIIVAMASRDCNFGAEPTTIGYNVAAGLVAHSSVAKVTTIKNCGNAAMAVILTAPVAYGALADEPTHHNYVLFQFKERLYVFKLSEDYPGQLMQINRHHLIVFVTSF
uniref:Uncharacterized protein n=1 Tax=Glossina brevipalpis TaxID=37001 RepID=A0A1A9W327_9MUSC